MPQPVCPITLPLMVPARLPARDGDNKPLLFFMTRTQKATIREKKWNHCEVLGNRAAFCGASSFDVWRELKKKRQRYCWQLPFPMPELRSTYFGTVSMVLWKWSLGREVLFALTIAGSVSNGPGTSETRRQQKPLALLSHLRRYKKNNNEGWAQSPCPTESSGIFNPVSLNLICEYRRWNSLAVRASLSFSRMKQKGIKQLQTKVSTQLGILSSHKVLLQRLTVTFTGSENRPRGIQRLFKRHRVFMEPSEEV